MRVGVGACLWVGACAWAWGVCGGPAARKSAVAGFELLCLLRLLCLLCLHPLLAVPLARRCCSCAWMLRRHPPPSLCPCNVLTCCSYSVECDAIHLP